MTRTQNSVFNMITSLGSSLLLVILNFITRSVFINSLGTNYLGIEGYFSNILSMLSLAELGFGSAIVYKLYKPLAEQDKQRILVLMKLFRRVYQVVGLVILSLGICLIPALPYLVKDYETFAALGLNPVIVFLIYLLNSASSYWFFAYKTVYITTNQKSYVLTLVNYIFNISYTIIQILLLVLTQNFLYYVLLPLVFTIIHNLVNARICDRRYPLLRERVRESVTREELKEFFKDCFALMLYRINNTILNASDNIILTALSGLTATGLYANYLSIKAALKSLLYSFSASFRASLGNMYASGNLEWTRLVFHTVNFITVWLYGVAAIGVAVLANDFIFLWLHNADFVVTSWTTSNGTFPAPVALLVGIELFLAGQCYYCDVCRDSMGLFRQMKYRPIASVLVNLVVVIATVPYIGIAGCVLGTVASYTLTNLIFDPIIIFKHALKQSPWPYFGRNILYKAVIVLSGLFCWWLCSLIPLRGIPGFIIHGCVCVAVPSLIFAGSFFRTQEFRYLLNTAKDFLHKRLAQDTASDESTE